MLLAPLRHLFGSLLLAVVLMNFAGFALGQEEKTETEPTAKAATAARWRWLKGTYWYVPSSNLPAINYSSVSNTVTPAADQTVYEITGYVDGYFWGRTVVQMSGQEKEYLALVGSITPEGDVLLTFIPFDSGARGLVTQGKGKMRRKFGRWAMENQMTSGPNSAFQVAHWAYMLQAKRGSKVWRSLPGVQVSIPTFFEDCPDAPVFQRN